jgi:hypothetical protein
VAACVRWTQPTALPWSMSVQGSCWATAGAAHFMEAACNRATQACSVPMTRSPLQPPACTHGRHPPPPAPPSSPGPRRRWCCSRRWWHGSWTPPGRGWAGRTPGSGPPPAAAAGPGGRGQRESHKRHRAGWLGGPHVVPCGQHVSRVQPCSHGCPTLCSAVLTPPSPSQPSCTAPALLSPGEGAAPPQPGPAPAAPAARGRHHHQAALALQQQPPHHCAPRRAGSGCCCWCWCCQQAAPGYWRRCCCHPLRLDCPGRGRYRRPRCCAGPGDR